MPFRRFLEVVVVVSLDQIINRESSLCFKKRDSHYVLASHADSLRDSSRVPPPRLLKRAGIYVDQSQRTSRFWKCSLDPEKFCVRSLQGNGFRVIAIIIKEKVEHINFMLWHTCLRLCTEWVRLDFVWLKQFAPVRFDSNRQTYSGVRLGLVSPAHFFFFFWGVGGELFQWRCLVWIIPFLAVLRLTWFKVCFIFQIVETLSTNGRLATYTKTLNQFLLKIIAKSSLKISGFNVMDYFQAFFSLLVLS